MDNMRQHRSKVMTALVCGAILGASITLVGLRAAGFQFTPGMNSPAFQKFFAVYRDLSQKYYTHESDRTLLNGAIVGMTQSLKDPFTDYFNPTAANQFQSMLQGSYEGIGVVMEQRGSDFVVVSVTPGGPAQKAGIKPNDKIVAVGGHAIQGQSVDQVSARILGPAGTKVKLTIQRGAAPGEVLHFTITRHKITAPTVYSKMLPHKVGYLRITMVGEHTADEFHKALGKVERQGAERLILDFRGNGGGYLEQATAIADQVIPKGKVIVQTEGRNQSPEKTLSQGPGNALPIVVLMDQDTASAAEILSAALHDDRGAPLVGTKSYGKGTVQETEMYADGSGLKYTVGRWLTPTGEWIHHKGLKPTVAVSLPSYAALPPITNLHLPLRWNQNSAAVQTLQQALSALQYHVDRTDGYFDDSTKAAVEKFQSAHGLPGTGVVDAGTADQIQSALDALVQKSDTQLDKAEQVVLGLKK